MTTNNHKMLWFIVFAITLLSSGRGGNAQPSGCLNNVISGLSSCIGYLRGNSSRPLPSCCTALANVQQSQPDCLCPMMLSNGASFTLGIAVNRTLAMALPTTCKLSTPQCHDAAAAGPSASSPLSPPADDRASSPPSTVPETTVPASDFPSGSKTIPNAAIHLKTITSATLFMVAAWNLI